MLHRTVAQISRVCRGVTRRGRNIVVGGATAAVMLMMRRLLLVRLLIEHAYFVFLEVAKEQLLVDIETEGKLMACWGFVVVVHDYHGWAMVMV